MVFVNSVSDLFYGDESDRQRCERQGIPFHPIPDDFIDRVFAVMALTPQHTYQVLTKRAERMRRYVDDAREDSFTGSRGRVARLVKEMHPKSGRGIAPIDIHAWALKRWPLPNVWLGVSVENGRWKSRVIPELVSTPAAVRFVSVEPLLEDLGDISDWFPREREVSQTKSVWIDGVNWVIVGGESGHEARPFDIAWARSIVAQCQAAGCPVFVKQLGSNAISETDGIASSSVSWNGIETKFAKGERGMDYRRLKSAKGGDPSEWPADLRIRQFPAERTVSRGTS